MANPFGKWKSGKAEKRTLPRRNALESSRFGARSPQARKPGPRRRAAGRPAARAGWEKGAPLRFQISYFTKRHLRNEACGPFPPRGKQRRHVPPQTSRKGSRSKGRTRLFRRRPDARHLAPGQPLTRKSGGAARDGFAAHAAPPCWKGRGVPPRPTTCRLVDWPTWSSRQVAESSSRRIPCFRHGVKYET